MLWAGRLGQQMRIAEPPESAGGAEAKAGGLKLSFSERPPSPALWRPRTERDRRFGRVVAAVVFVVGGLVLAWSAGTVSEQTMLRAAYAAVAAVIWIYAAWQIPDIPAIAEYRARGGVPVRRDGPEPTKACAG